MCQSYFGFIVLLVGSLIVVYAPVTEAVPHSGRIVGGTEVRDISEYPFQASLRYYAYHRCGASILSANWALSATHCLTGSLEMTHLSLLVGSVYLNNDGQRGTIHVFQEYFLHPKYNSSNYDFDVAVIRVRDPFHLGPNVGVIRPVTQDMPVITGEGVTILGWGWTATGQESQILLKSTIPLVDDEICEEFWGANIFTNRMMCSGEPGRDTCSGDSGGPLIFRGLQVGITSSGTPHCNGEVPSLYTRISHPDVRQFIREHTGV